MRVTFCAACVLSVVGVTAGGALAQNRDWAAASNGNWGVAGNWSPANIPDTVGETATIDQVGTYTVTVGNSFTVGGLSMPRANPSLTISGGSNLTIGAGTVACNGTINVAGTGGNNQLVFGAPNIFVTGSGVIQMDAVGGNLATARINQSSGGSATLDIDMTIRGDGVIFAPMTNNGLIVANEPGSALNLLSPITNGGTLRATNSTLLIQTVITGAAFGRIVSNNGVVDFGAGSQAISCVMEATNGGVINLAGVNATTTFTSTPVMLGGDMYVMNGGTMRLGGGVMSNDGLIRVYPGLGVGNAVIECQGSVTLNGGGSIILNAPAGQRSLAQFNTAVPVSMNIINSVNHTLGGVGMMNSRVSNNGMLKPGVAGSAGVLELQAGLGCGETSTIECDIFGRLPGECDSILLTSSANTTINGTLRMVCKPGYVPVTGDSFVIMTAPGGIAGTFDAVEVTGTLRTVSASVQRTSTNVTVTFDHVCRGIDFNNDDLFPDTEDIADFIRVFAGGVCSTGNCDPIDFNTDTLFPDTLDIDAFLSVFAGGPCL